MIKIERPPNYDRIVSVFPHAKRPGVLFAYGEDIYNPSDVNMPGFLVKHEYRHCARQWLESPEAWWEKYLTDPEFRYDEELLAHVDEYKFQIPPSGAPRNYRRLLLRTTAKRLTAKLYEYDFSLERAMKDIKALV